MAAGVRVGTGELANLDAVGEGGGRDEVFGVGLEGVGVLGRGGGEEVF